MTGGVAESKAGTDGIAGADFSFHRRIHMIPEIVRALCRPARDYEIPSVSRVNCAIGRRDTGRESSPLSMPTRSSKCH